MRAILLAAAILATAALEMRPVDARTLGAGPGQEFDLPSRAIAAAQHGDTVLIEPGTYYDCATWTANAITVAGRAPGVVLSDTTCGAKAILVIRGNDAVVRDLTLARARVPDGNGAGIRLEGQSLQLERVRFVNNEVGVLAGVGGPGAIRVMECRFEGGGVAGDRPSVALSIGPVALLHVERSVFAGVKGSQVGSSALQTEVVGNQIATARLGVSAAGGSLLLEDNVLELTPGGSGLQAAVLANGDTRVTMRRNRLLNHTGRPSTLLLDWTDGVPLLDGNVVAASDHETASDGIWRHRGGAVFQGMKDGVRGLLIVARQVLGR
jgi:hypothetical protein